MNDYETVDETTTLEDTQQEWEAYVASCGDWNLSPEDVDLCPEGRHTIGTCSCGILPILDFTDCPF